MQIIADEGIRVYVKISYKCFLFMKLTLKYFPANVNLKLGTRFTFIGLRTDPLAETEIFCLRQIYLLKCIDSDVA